MTEPGDTSPSGPPGSADRGSETEKRIRENLQTTIIAVPLQKSLEEDCKTPYHVIIDVNLEYRHGRANARDWIVEEVAKIVRELGLSAQGPDWQGINIEKSKLSQQYLFARLNGTVINELVRRDANRPKPPPADPNRPAPPPAPVSLMQGGPDRAVGETARRTIAIYHIWPDFEVRALINRTVATVKADAAHNAFSAMGAGIVWAVLDSGIDATHPHFQLHDNLNLDAHLGNAHRDFTGAGQPLVDRCGHGTHVAGIIAGEMSSTQGKIIATMKHRSETGEVVSKEFELPAISGMAPKCKLVSMKVLEDNGLGTCSSLIAALEAIQEINGYGRRILIHGVNLSVGYDFDPQWFACGQSPLCVEVNRLVKSGVSVVVAAGNSGYGLEKTSFTGVIAAGLALTINDPGNADLAITVGSTHRDKPHEYGVSYFSSKGPTGDGRLKPDLVAPGEKILSCTSSQMAAGGVSGSTPGLGRASALGGKAGQPMPYSSIPPVTANLLAAVGTPPVSAPPSPPPPPAAVPPPPPAASTLPPVTSALLAAADPALASPPAPSVKTAAQGQPVRSVSTDVGPAVGRYREESGTSMAAPHVSGVIAAFLSIRREFIGRPEQVKEIFLSTATDLKRLSYFQGKGMVDLMRAIQSV